MENPDKTAAVTKVQTDNRIGDGVTKDVGYRDTSHLGKLQTFYFTFINCEML